VKSHGKETLRDALLGKKEPNERGEKVEVGQKDNKANASYLRNVGIAEKRKLKETRRGSRVPFSRNDRK